MSLKTEKSIPTWILIVSALFALMEIMVSIMLWTSPQSALESVDLKAKGVNYLVQMWAVRQFALGVIIGFAALRKSASMLTLAYIFFLVMFIGDFIIGVLQKENSLMISSVVMSGISASIIYAISRIKIKSMQ